MQGSDALGKISLWSGVCKLFYKESDLKAGLQNDSSVIFFTKKVMRICASPDKRVRG